MELYCLGDSLTFGYGVSRTQRWVQLAAEESGWQLINMGISGDTTGGMLARMQTQLLPRLAQQHGGYVLLMGGGNDIFYGGSAVPARVNMGAMAHQLMSVGAVPIIGSPIPLCTEDVPQEWRCAVDFPQAAGLTAEYRAWCAGFCRAFAVPFIDLYDDFLCDGLPDRTLYLDGLHPTPQGHQLIAHRVAETLKALEEHTWR